MDKLKIGLMGYGKMGKEIEKAAKHKGHEISLKVTSENAASVTDQDLSFCDVIIEFSRPDVAAGNIRKCLDAAVPVVSGTTGWYASLDEIRAYCSKKNGSFVYASNFSIGVNILFEINAHLAALMKRLDGYQAIIYEAHHIQKLDIPSGTAITLAEDIMQEQPSKTGWTSGHASENEIQIQSTREGNIVGFHSIRYTSATDEIEISHNAFNRNGFASGAVLAAEFAVKNKGVFNMKDVISKM
jgi:4-hydroxy-tetrahydrodipicolinate reductase